MDIDLCGVVFSVPPRRLKDQCADCMEIKSSDEFYKTGTRCKPCQNQYRRNLRRSSAERMARYLVQQSRYRARKTGMPFDLDIEWVALRLAAGACEVSGIAFEGEGPLVPSLDRIDAGGGYTKDNTRVVCNYVNRAINDQGLDFFIEVARKVVEKNT